MTVTNGGSGSGSNRGSGGGSDRGSGGGSDRGSGGGSDEGSGAGSGPGRREVAYRVFAAEYEDSIVSYSESDEERAPNYVITPTGGRVNRLFVVGVLTEIERVSDEMLRARIVDPTGAFVTYAGQYQPDALGFLDATEPPTFVALTGKARTFQPEDSDRVYSSVRPETITEVDAETRDRWVVRTAELTLERVSTTAAAKLSGLHGDELRRALVDDGVDDARAAGVAIALAEYGTTGTYLQAVRDLALDAVRVVAGERDEARQLSASPGEGGDEPLEALVDDDRRLPVPATVPDGPSASGGDESDVEGLESGGSDAGEAPSDVTGASETGAGGIEAEGTEVGGTEAAGTEAAGTEAAGTEAAGTEAVGAEASELSSEGTRDSGSDPGEFETEEFETEESDPGEFEPGEFDMDEETRQQVQEEHGVEFETGSEVEGGEEPLDETAGMDSDNRDAGSEVESSDPDVATTEPEVESSEPDVEPADPETAGREREAGDDGETADLETALMETMAERSDGGGVDREELVATLVEEYGVSEDDVETAIQDALMSGQCYEPDEGTLKPI